MREPSVSAGGNEHDSGVRVRSGPAPAGTRCASTAMSVSLFLLRARRYPRPQMTRAVWQVAGTLVIQTTSKSHRSDRWAAGVGRLACFSCRAGKRAKWNRCGTAPPAKVGVAAHRGCPPSGTGSVHRRERVVPAPAHLASARRRAGRHHTPPVRGVPAGQTRAAVQKRLGPKLPDVGYSDFPPPPPGLLCDEYVDSDYIIAYRFCFRRGVLVSKASDRTK